VGNITATKKYQWLYSVTTFLFVIQQFMAQNITAEEIRKRTKEDVHSIGKLRVNGPLPNLQAFYDAFNLDETAEMYIKPEERAMIW
jgi:putative endopeptidase